MDDKQWLDGSLIKISNPAQNMRSLTFSVPGFGVHIPGQHVDIKLEAEGGYIAERSYSIANFPEKDMVELGVQFLDQGEVSPYLFSMDVEKRNKIMIRGPIGGHFIWDKFNDINRDLILVGGGSGMVPLISILRAVIFENDKKDNQEKELQNKIMIFSSARNPEVLAYHEIILDLCSKGDFIKYYPTVTDEIVIGTKNEIDIEKNWKGHTGRFTQEFVMNKIKHDKINNPIVFVCGPNSFVDAMTIFLSKSGIDDKSIKTERFG